MANGVRRRRVHHVDAYMDPLCVFGGEHCRARMGSGGTSTTTFMNSLGSPISWPLLLLVIANWANLMDPPACRAAIGAFTFISGLVVAFAM